MTGTCIGLTKKGRPCAAAAERGYRTCPQHRDQENGEVRTS